MLICGLKLTHDGAVALLEDDRLLFSVEMEKLDNGRRHSPVDDLASVPEVLGMFGYRVEDVDRWVIDGWDGKKSSVIELFDRGGPTKLVVGPYRESEAHPDPLAPTQTGTITFGADRYPYTSYTHAAGHVASTYASSPFAARGEPSLLLVWDGALFPALYQVDPSLGIEHVADLFPMIGHVYGIAAYHFGPFREPGQSPSTWDLSVAGKLMAYIALGKALPEVVEVLSAEFHRIFESDAPEAIAYRRAVGGYGSLAEPSMPPVHELFAAVRARIGDDIPDEDILASTHEFLQELLVERLTAYLDAGDGDGPWNLCFTGGCALNIKWNSAIRALPQVAQMWVPPFPNDSGSAIGAAVLGRAREVGLRPLDWSVRLGPALRPLNALPEGWTATACDAAGLARVLHRTGEPVVVLDGRAELGPRALGGRSILASPIAAGMKDVLNRVKGRESYRPVAPICLTADAPAVFDPGTPDPYMLFEHAVRDAWRDRVPAVVHLDGTARLQTVDPASNPFLASVLSAYRSLSGVPVLCNTSANFHGSGFFPDVASAMAWGQLDRIWSDGVLYQRNPGAVGRGA